MIEEPDREPSQDSQKRPAVTPAVQIVAMLCITAIIVTFLIGIFVIAR